MKKIYDDVLKLFENNENQIFNINDIAKKINISYDTTKRQLHKLVKENKLERIVDGTYCLKGADIKQIIINKSFSAKVWRYHKILIPHLFAEKLNLKGAYVKVRIIKNNKTETFLAKTIYSPISRETVMHINNSVCDKLKIIIGDTVRIVKIESVYPITQEKKIFNGNKIDLMSLLPKKTRKGFDVFALPEKSKIILWYHAGNRGTKQLTIKRYISSKDLGTLLGQLQAEGSKFKKIKEKESPRLVFTNKLISEHKEFINILKNLEISKEIIKVHCYYNSDKIPKKTLDNHINTFIKLTNIKPKIHDYRLQSPKTTINFQTAVERTILAELFLNGMNIMRGKVANCNKLKDNLREFGEGFLAKLLIGDGSVSLRRSSGNSLVFGGYISDCDTEYKKDYKKILKKFGISVATYETDNRIFFKCNKENLEFLYKIKAFHGTKNWYKLIQAILLRNSKLYEKFKKLQRFQIFTNDDVKNCFNISKSGAKIWLRYRRNEGFFEVSEIEGKKYFYKPTQKYTDFLSFIKKCDEKLKDWGVKHGNLTKFDKEISQTRI